MSAGGNFPLTLRVAGRKVVVVGGGHVATRRALSLVEADALVTLISPIISESLNSAVSRGDINWLQRTYERGDLDGAWLVQTATASPDIDEQVAVDAEAGQIWCLKGGDPENATACHLLSPASTTSWSP